MHQLAREREERRLPMDALVANSLNKEEEARESEERRLSINVSVGKREGGEEATVQCFD